MGAQHDHARDHAPDAPSGPPSHPASTSRSAGRVLGVLGLVLVAVFLVSQFVDSGPGQPSAQAHSPSTPTQMESQAVAVHPATAGSQPEAELTGEMLNVASATLTSQYGYPAAAGVSAQIMSTADGRACDNLGSRDDFGGYPVAWCKTWKASTGLTSGVPLSPGELFVTCQYNLDTSNPVFTANQENTWWFWARSDQGTWDWFPETALSQGATTQPTNGIAICEL